MQTIILNHRVADYATWKTLYDADAPRRNNAGLREIKVGTKAGDPNLVYIIFEANNVSEIQDMFNDPGMKEYMKKAGVISEPEVVVIN
jgi:hypothetical protein